MCSRASGTRSHHGRRGADRACKGVWRLLELRGINCRRLFFGAARQGKNFNIWIWICEGCAGPANRGECGPVFQYDSCPPGFRYPGCESSEGMPEATAADSQTAEFWPACSAGDPGLSNCG